MIDIKTTPAAVAYSINNQPMTPVQLAGWMKNAIEQFGDKEPVLIQPDSQTTFATVFTLLESLKASGVKHFEIITERSDSPSSITIRSLAASAEHVKRDQIQKLPPPK
jgi:biopolymer transport protein ExbD